MPSLHLSAKPGSPSTSPGRSSAPGLDHFAFLARSLSSFPPLFLNWQLTTECCVPGALSTDKSFLLLSAALPHTDSSRQLVLFAVSDCQLISALASTTSTSLWQQDCISATLLQVQLSFLLFLPTFSQTVTAPVGNGGAKASLVVPSQMFHHSACTVQIFVCFAAPRACARLGDWASVSVQVLVRAVPHPTASHHSEQFHTESTESSAESFTFHPFPRKASPFFLCTSMPVHKCRHGHTHTHPHTLCTRIHTRAQHTLHMCSLTHTQAQARITSQNGLG